MERAAAAREWCAWEDAIAPTAGPSPRFEDPRFRLAFARIVTHYWGNGHFLGPDGVLLAGTPWLLAHAWPDADLVMVDEGAHETATPGMAGALVAATDRFREISPGP